jgi:hypothetical protein
VIDICEVVPDDPAAPINPNFPAQHSTPLCAGQVKPFVDGFSNTTSHDLGYHGWKLLVGTAGRGLHPTFTGMNSAGFRFAMSTTWA